MKARLFLITGAMATLLMQVAPATADTTIVDENFDSYVTGGGGPDQAAFEAVWVPASTTAALLVPGQATAEPPNDNPPGIQGLGANLFGSLNTYQGSSISIQPTETQSVRLTMDLFDDIVGNKRNTVGLRSSAPANLVELGNWNADAVDPTDGTTAIPAANYAYRAVLFGSIGDGIVQQPSWQYFELNPALDRENTPENLDIDDITTAQDIGPGWHRYSVTITPTTVTFSLDLFRDGVTNLTRGEDGKIEIGVGDAGVDSEKTWNLNLFDAPFDSLRIGGASGVSSAHESVVDNILLELIDVAAPAGDADFNDSLLVDGADFLIWQRGYPVTDQTATNATGDANSDLDVTAADLAIWQSQFGTSPATPAVSAVPEPATLALAGLALTVLLARRQRD